MSDENDNEKLQLALRLVRRERDELLEALRAITELRHIERAIDIANQAIARHEARWTNE